MVVVGERLSESQRLSQSAEAVQVVETERAQQQTGDLGEVLARVQGIGVRRDGGLGSAVRFTLNGLTDDQVRMYLDGVPLEQSGYPFGIANVPVNLLDRVEIYRGVVPVRFGADALGGAVNLVTPDVRQSYLGGSYQIGSFGTHRVTIDGRYHDAPSGFVLAHSAFLDVAKNDYPVQVDLPQPDGSLAPTKVRRFHDAYRAFGARLEGGLVDRPWAKRLLLSGYVSSADKQIQNNLWMTGPPFGEPVFRQDVYGATARYLVRPTILGTQFDVDAVANYSYRTYGLRDVSSHRYSWTGEQTATIPNRKSWGEIGDAPVDELLRQHALYARVLTTWEPATEHALRLALTPAYTARTGDNRFEVEPGATDVLNAKNALLTFVAGVEYELNLFDDRLSNIVFAKAYVYRASGQEQAAAGGGLEQTHADRQTQGAGDMLRLRATRWLDVKASYEYATRLPRADEVLGNGALVLPNLQLLPEVSHNVNLGPHLAAKRTRLGSVSLDVNMFLRALDRLILLLGSGRSGKFSNVYSARSLGVESALSWSAPGGWLSLDGTLTWQDFRNTARSGDFADTRGDRVPNRPYLFGSWGARARLDDVILKTDSLEPFYLGRYVHSFYVAWGSVGDPATKLSVPLQVTHDLGVSWIFENDVARITATAEIQNVTDARLYDNYGVQRPGRAFYVKLAAHVR